MKLFMIAAGTRFIQFLLRERANRPEILILRHAFSKSKYRLSRFRCISDTQYHQLEEHLNVLL